MMTRTTISTMTTRMTMRKRRLRRSELALLPRAA
jgi:hypothetical protein